MGFFSKIAEGIKKTKDSMMGKFESLVNSFTKIDEEFFEELEEILITCDIGVETSVQICERLRGKVKEKGLTDPSEIIESLKEIIAEMLGEDKPIDISSKPAVILVIGVNGAGKTTTIGKLSAKYKNDGKSVLVAAADTFRAAAIEQLEVWTQRAGVDIIKHSEGSDPASVIFDALQAAKARGTDILICDTAGRLHNKKNLMEELKKISRIVHEQAEGCSLETLLVLDATTGQNAVNQAKLFSEAAEITGIVLTKLDGTAKGGIIISIHNELRIPVKLVGVGEKIDDLQEFNAADFASALFDNETDFEYNYERLTDEEENANKDEVDNGDEMTENSSSDDSEEISSVSQEEKTNAVSVDNNADKTVNINKIDAKDGEIENKAEISEENGKNISENAKIFANEAGAPDEEDEPEKPEKKSIKDGKLGFLFKEITFGKKKKPEEGENSEENSEPEENSGSGDEN